jgi:hypothetical protein
VDYSFGKAALQDLTMSDEKPKGMNRILAGVLAAAFAAWIAVGLMTGGLAGGRYAYLNRETDPFYFWTGIAMIAALAIYAALLSFGVVELKAPPSEDFARQTRKEIPRRLVFLALLLSAGSAWNWWTMQGEGRQGVMTAVSGWIAIGALGIAALPPVLPRGPSRSALRMAGAVVALLAAVMIARLIL